MNLTQTTLDHSVDASMSQGGVDVQAARLRRLVRMRWAGGAAILVLALLEWALVAAGKLAYGPWMWLGALGLGLLAHNLVTWLILKGYRTDAQTGLLKKLRLIANGALGLDLLIWLATIHLTGGVLNPLAAVLVFILGLAAGLLPLRQAYIQAGIAAGLYVALGVGEIMFPAFRSPSPSYAPLAWLVAVPVILVTVVYFMGAILRRLRRINHRLLAANRELSALDLTKSRFLRVSSHQLRAPLAAVHSFTSAIQAVGGLNPKQFDLLRKARTRIEDVMTQLDEMLLLSTIKENAAETFDRGSVKLTTASSEAVADFEEEARSKGVTLRLLQGNDEACVSAWPDALETVLEHLISNAVKYTPEGGTVTVSARNAGQNVEVEVADTGIGIPPGQLEQVCREFFRATNARQVCSGTGLGLSISQAIVERLGGRMKIRSAQGEGTNVEVVLPISHHAQAGSDEPYKESSTNQDKQLHTSSRTS